MSVKVFITVDTEEDSWAEFNAKCNPVDNISRIPMVQEIFDRYGAIPTYLVTYPVVRDKRSLRILEEIIDSGRCEIGTHCHPWNTPPVHEAQNEAHSMLANLEEQLIYQKVNNLHKAIADCFGVDPICFRAGRWAFNDRVARTILRMGYRVDTSITPLLDWTNKNGPNFCEAPILPYRFDPSDILAERQDGALLEVPPTVGFLQKNLSRCTRIRRVILRGPFSTLHVSGILDRLRILNYRWLSPEHASGGEMIRLTKNLMRPDHPYLNMAFHSPSLLPGKTPFVRDEGDLKRLLSSVESLLQFAASQAMSFLPLRGVLNGPDG